MWVWCEARLRSSRRTRSGGRTRLGLGLNGGRGDWQVERRHRDDARAEIDLALDHDTGVAADGASSAHRGDESCRKGAEPELALRVRCRFAAALGIGDLGPIDADVGPGERDIGAGDWLVGVRFDDVSDEDRDGGVGGACT